MSRTDARHDGDILTGFVEEAHDLLRQVSDAAVQLSAGQVDGGRDLMRATHTMRGAAAAVGLRELSEVAASAETIADKVRSGRADWTVSVLQAVQDFVESSSKYLSELQSDAPPPPVAGLLRSRAMLDELGDEDDEDDEVYEILREEARDYLEDINRHLRQLVRQPERRDLLEDIRRPTHTLKGSAATVGFEELSYLAHRFEDLVEAEAQGTGAISETRLRLLLDVAEALDDLLRRPPEASRSPEIAQLLTQIEDAMGTGDVAATEEDAFSSAVTQELSVPQDAVDADRPQPAPAPPESDTARDLPDEIAAQGPGERPSEEPEPTAVSGDEVGEISSAPTTVSQGKEPVSPAGSDRRPSPTSEDAPTRSERLLRIPAAKLSDAVRVAGELLLHRSSFDRSFSELSRVAGELGIALSRLSRLSSRLETEYEARALLGAESPNPTARDAEFDSLEFDRYSELHLISRQLAETASDIGAVQTGLSQTVGTFDVVGSRLGRLVSELGDRLSGLQRVPMTDLQSRLFRTIRAAEKAAGRKVDLVVDVAGVDLDKNVLDELSEPLLHALRNAVDHGIEPPADRLAAGKAERGTVRVTARYLGNHVEITISDDGRGLDLEGLRRTAIQNGLLTPEEAQRLPDDQVAQLAFSPRVSTAKEVSQLSGRGVGLEVLKAAAERLRGRAMLESTPGSGTQVHLQIPMTLAAMRALFVNTNGQGLAIPQAAVEEILRLESDAVESIGEDRIARLGEEVLPIVDLGTHLGLPADEPESWPKLTLVTRTGAGKVALLVDSLGGSRDVVVKPLGPLLTGLEGFIGATLDADGSVVLFLDPAHLTRDRAAPSALPETLAEAEPSQEVQVLVVDDSLSVRRVLKRLIASRGWSGEVARDGQEALELIQSGYQPNVILLDIEMPRMDGYELTSVLRADPRHADLPIVMLTSRAGAKHRAKAAEVGANGYLVKPYDEETLVQTIRQVADF